MPVVLTLLLLCATSAGAQTNSDELTKMVATYELTMPRIEGYGAVMAGIADWATRDPKAVTAMMARAPKGPISLSDSAAMFEKELPADRISPKNVALAKANAAAIDAVMKKAQADRLRAFPQPQ